MTALRPLATSLVRGVSAVRYPLNTVCAQPECTEPAADPHHCFPRSQIKSDSWFVKILGQEPIPHVTGLCRAHHDDVEEHRAWIKLEDDNFVWWDYKGSATQIGVDKFDEGGEWARLGPLNPQPGSKEGRPKRPRYKGEARRNRATLSLRVPADEREDGAGLLNDLQAEVEEKLGHKPPRSIYYTIVDSFNFVLAHADVTDV